MKTDAIDLTAEYRELLLQYDVLKITFSDLYARKNEMISYEEPLLTALYLDTVGRKLYEKYCLTVEITLLKQRIGLIQAYQNRNEKPDWEAIEQEIGKRFTAYQQTIEAEAQRIKAAADLLKGGFLSEEATKKLKEVYHLIVKRLHPDLHPDQMETEKDLFIQAQAAYDMSDLTALNEILLSLDLKAPVKTGTTPQLREKVQHLAEKTDALKAQLEESEKKFPFSYREKLADPDWVATEKKTTELEIQSLMTDRTQLTNYLIILKTWTPESLN